MSHQLIVAIGRESGSGGLDIAHALAERLQLPCSTRAFCKKPQRARASAPKRWSATMSALTPPVLPLRPGHQQRPGGLRGPDAV